MRTVNDWLERRAQLTPERTALVDATRGEQRVTYAEWNALANRTARLLREELGVERQDRVAVLAMNCTETLDLLFACGKLGAIVQPLNWRLSEAELARTLAESGAKVLVYGPDFRAQAVALRERVHSLRHLVALAPVGDEPRGVLPFSARDALPATGLPRVELEVDTPWVLCPTGGSTGTPKAAVLTHGSISANAHNTVVSWGLTHDDVALLNAPLFHTGGLNVFTLPLVHVGGASVVCRAFSVEEVFERVASGQVSVLFGVPTMFIELQRHPRFEEVDFSRLKLVISGGAPCPDSVFQRFFEHGVDFRTGYGLTEAGPNTFHLPPFLAREKRGAVGYPLWHVEVRLDGVPEDGPGGPAELLIRGPHLFAGYWGRPEESARAVEGGWLHTGDLATRDAEGCYRIVGRAKELIISGGENVYPAEVESVLSGHPAVAEVVVIGVPDAKWGEVPRAVVVCRSGMTLSVDELLGYCRERLARFKTPRSVVLVDALPRTATLKLDRRALTEAHGKPT
ncbi:MAG: long-chain fatty acid--CoA ligase [Myxococcaceae bacterium]|nr:long-chain fatty acid--CoA ligase [Myxococcaceae bacterium]MCI0669555.1 long-chain fatty acid--CoA ligase [Myxococcaceae bacterium]